MTSADYMLINARRSKTACFCGDNIDDEYKIYKAIDDAVSQEYDHFLFCAEKESGLDFAKQVILRKKKQKGNNADKIILVAVVTDERHSDNKSEEFRNEYFKILAECDYFVELKNNDFLSCEKFIITKSSKLI